MRSIEELTKHQTERDRTPIVEEGPLDALITLLDDGVSDAYGIRLWREIRDRLAAIETRKPAEQPTPQHEPCAECGREFDLIRSGGIFCHCPNHCYSLPIRATEAEAWAASDFAMRAIREAKEAGR